VIVLWIGLTAVFFASVPVFAQSDLSIEIVRPMRDTTGQAMDMILFSKSGPWSDVGNGITLLGLAGNDEAGRPRVQIFKTDKGGYFFKALDRGGKPVETAKDEATGKELGTPVTADVYNELEADLLTLSDKANLACPVLISFDIASRKVRVHPACSRLSSVKIKNRVG
jgi:hypothetical protein